MSITDALLKKVQAASGLGFGSFLVLHLCNTLSGHISPAVYDSVQSVLRCYYQNPAVELVMVFGSLSIHVGASLWRMQKRVAADAVLAQSLKHELSTADVSATSAPDPKAVRAAAAGPDTMTLSLVRKLHRLSGLALLPLISVHVMATRLSPIVSGVVPDMTIVTGSSVWKAFVPLGALLVSSVLAMTGYYWHIATPRVYTDYVQLHEVYMQYVPDVVRKHLPH
ncbi:hypothetical protein CAOG_07354 [Capsaspora owczarzaki ATCC 30864]|uniref:Uncharacterized protein n=1 Tax=Capsaspora owczarzaki (strain ATCC 30864) TaxID=595528 RepID=A0A0D2W030_CAPO3|nr:hypothetical protein CAOG_07354 [Capsaspora owczarzaki ATCC 30864]KJE97507.1 hypothetical protein CAOG_007354 [Capsaspora owczarzaki ATCC 30864]|eukprot:XP_004343213.2 hypothetical protein CAOG_07354 [Capsaspora owczarzaki ATCC 30864]